ncbi:MAG: hypothetical protein AAB470_00285 [Patescibacteria group bacterium]
MSWRERTDTVFASSVYCSLFPPLAILRSLYERMFGTHSGLPSPVHT